MFESQMQEIMSVIRDAIAMRQEELAELPGFVQNWISYMRAVFFGGIIFVPWRTEARFVVLTMVATAILLIGLKITFPLIHSGSVGTVVHLLLWSPLLVYLIMRRRAIMAHLTGGQLLGALYGLWVSVVSITLAASLVLDGRTFFRWFQ